MKLVLLTLAFIPISIVVFSQNSDLEELEAQRIKLVTSPADIPMLNQLATLCSSTVWLNPDRAYSDAVTGLLSARKIGYQKGEANFLQIIGVSFYLGSDYTNALDYSLQALQMAEQINDYNIGMLSYFSLMSILRDEQDYQEALRYGFDAKKKAEKNHDSSKLSTVDMIIGSVYARMNQLDSAHYYLKKSYQYNKKTRQQNAYNALELGRIYFKLKQYDLALKYYKESEINAVPKDLADTYMGLAHVFKMTKQIDSCLTYAKKALDVGQASKYYIGVIDAGNFMASLYESSDIRKAYTFHRLASAAKDSVYNIGKVRQSQSLKFGEQIRLQEIEQAKLAYQNKIKGRTFLGLLIGLGIIAMLLYRNNQHKQKTNALLREQKEKVESALSHLQSTQAQLIQSEKLASLGELTAGIAHEIQNPLNFVNNFAEVSSEMLEEMEEEIKTGNTSEAIAIATDLKTNLGKINHHGQRASSIVKGMLEHSRASTGVKEPTDLNALADEFLRLAYHGLRAKDNNFNATIETHFDPDLPKVSVVPQDIGRVLLNLINNAFYAVHQRAITVGASLAGAQPYVPTVTVSTKRLDNTIEICVQDNGNGIPETILDKIFQPFFTTKPTGQGTGLGLSLAYDIVTKGHGGILEVESMEKQGTIFTIKIPT